MRPVRAIGVAAAAAALSGCGASAQDQVKAKVEQFAGASARKDYRTICRQVLAPSLVEHLRSNGIGCEQALEVALGGVRDPTLSIGLVTVQGQSATVITLSMARGQQSSLDSIKLVQTGPGWRISALGSPLR